MVRRCIIVHAALAALLLTLDFADGVGEAKKTKSAKEGAGHHHLQSLSALTKEMKKAGWVAVYIRQPYRKERIYGIAEGKNLTKFSSKAYLVYSWVVASGPVKIAKKEVVFRFHWCPKELLILADKDAKYSTRVSRSAASPTINHGIHQEADKSLWVLTYRQALENKKKRKLVLLQSKMDIVVGGKVVKSYFRHDFEFVSFVKQARAKPN